MFLWNVEWKKVHKVWMPKKQPDKVAIAEKTQEHVEKALAIAEKTQEVDPERFQTTLKPIRVRASNVNPIHTSNPFRFLEGDIVGKYDRNRENQ